MGLLSKTTTLHVHHALLYISLSSLHDYHVEMPDSRFMDDVNKRPRIFISLSKLESVPKKSTLGKFARIYSGILVNCPVWCRRIFVRNFPVLLISLSRWFINMATKLSLVNTMFSICNNVKKWPGWLSTQENSFERIYMKIEIPSSRLCSRQQRTRDVRAYGPFTSIRMVMK